MVLVIDGLGDLPNPQLEGQTPLEAAQTAGMDRLAACGRYGLVDPIAPGVIPNTHSGTGLLMGMLPEQDRMLSRGPVEAAGAGLELSEGDVAFRANFATLERTTDGFLVIDRRAGRITENTSKLADALDGMDLGDGIVARLQSTDQHRCVLVLKGQGLDARIGKTDPGDQPMPAMMRPSKARVPEAFFTAAKLQLFVEKSYDTLSNHPVNRERRAQGLLPANGILARGAGVAFRLDSLAREARLETAVVAGCNTVIGMARLFGFNALSDARFTADTETDVGAKIQAAVQALDHHRLVFVHIKAPDILSHDQDPLGKRDFLEKIDVELARLGLPEFAVLVTADHSTDSNTGAHTADPVPVLFYEPAKRSGKASAAMNPPFSEASCRSGNLSRRSGFEMMQEVIQFLS